MAVAAWLRGHEPHDTVIGKRTDGIHKRINQVAVVVAPPQEHDVHHVVVVVVDEFDSISLRQRRAQLLVAILVDADLPDNAVRVDAEDTHLAITGHGTNAATGIT